MWFKLVVIAIFLAFVLNRPLKVVRGSFMDTSKETAAKIQPGMTLEEVEQIIGGPPGRYVLAEEKTTIRKGLRKLQEPIVIVWEGYQGTIEVADGMSGQTEFCPHPGIEPDGIVDSVSWKPYDRASVDVLSSGTARAVVGMLVVIVLLVQLPISRGTVVSGCSRGL